MAAACFRFTINDLRFTIFKLFLFLTISFLLLTIPGAAHAQTPATPSSVIPTPNLERQITNQYFSGQSPHIASMAIYNFGHALTCILIGQSPIAPCLEYKFITDAQGTVKSYPILSSVNTTGGLLGLGGSALAMLYIEKPLDQASFFAYLGRNIGIVKEANAQVGGSGNQVLSPIFALWTVSRNFSYLVMILIFIGVGLMVMFRQKLNPQTVVSVQLALPGLVIGLILITFSYFLAALITDMAYVGTDLVGYYFDSAIKTVDSGFNPKPLTERLSNQSALSIGSGSSKIINEDTLESFVGQVFYNLPPDSNERLLNPSTVVRIFTGGLTYMLYNSFLSPIYDSISTLANSITGIIGGTGKITGAVKIISNIVGAAGTTDAATKGIQSFANPIGWLSFWGTILAVIILIFTIVKLFIRLINCYLTIILLTITSPFVFLASSIPGRQSLAVTWLRNMLCNVLSFPAVIAVFYFAAFLVGNDPQIPGFGVTKNLDLFVTSNLPFLGGLNLEFLRRILAFVAILATPSIPDVICRTVGKPSQSGALLAGAVGGAIAGGRQAEGQISGQTQKAGADIRSWKTSMFGTTPYTGGRGGNVQLGLHMLRTGKLPDIGKELGRATPVSGPKPNRWERLLEGIRRGGDAGPGSPGERAEGDTHRRF